MAQTNKSKNMLQVYGYKNGVRYSIHTTRLSDDYVYYQRLLNPRLEKNPVARAMGLQIQHSMDALNEASADFDDIYGKKLIAMAHNERDKEVAFLQKHFKSEINPLFLTEAVLVKAINNVLNIQGAFERNVERIKKNQIGITPTKFLDDYFEKAWNAQLETIIADISNLTVVADIAARIEQGVRDAAREALIKAFSSKTFKGQEDDKRVFQTLIAAIDGNSPTGNNLLEDFFSAYDLNGMKTRIENMLNDKSSNPQKVIEDMPNKIRAKHKTKSGNFYENVEHEVLGQIIEGLRGLNISKGLMNITVDIAHSGDSGIKADNILSFGFDLSGLVGDLRDIKKFEDVRDQNIKVVQDFQKKLAADGTMGDIVYINDKDYKLGANFKGFSAGKQKLGNFETAMSGYVSKDVMGLIRQTLHGAIGSENKGKIEHILAADIARWLFDDFDTIGDIPQTTINSIHLMSLDGVYIPLSVVLGRLGDAFLQADAEAEHGLVAVAIENKSIIWSRQPNGGWTSEMWDQQRDDARNLMIETKFLAGFKNLIEQLG